MHPVLILSEKKDQCKCCIKPLIGAEHIRIILHAQRGSCYAAAYVVPLAPEFSALICLRGSACAPTEHAACAAWPLCTHDLNPARLEVWAWRHRRRSGWVAEAVMMAPRCAYSTAAAFNPLFAWTYTSSTLGCFLLSPENIFYPNPCRYHSPVSNPPPASALSHSWLGWLLRDSAPLSADRWRIAPELLQSNAAQLKFIIDHQPA